MFPSSLLDPIPLWAVPPITFLIVVVSQELGYRLGRHYHRRSKPDSESPVGTLLGATLSLLAFILAFTFGMAGARYDFRRQVYVDEVNAIGTTFLRAALLPEPHRKQVEAALRRYTEIRLDLSNLPVIIRESDSLHRKLWSHAATLGREHPESITIGLFIQSLNETIDLHTKRVYAAFQSRIPDVLWCIMYLLTFVSMLVVGFQAGRSGGERSLASFGLAIAFTAVIYLITDLDRPGEGVIRINKQLMRNLRESMEENPQPAVPRAALGALKYTRQDLNL